MRTGEDGGARATRSVRPRRRVARVVAALGAVVVLAATSCMPWRMAPLSYELVCAMEGDSALPEGAVLRESGSVTYVCVFGVTDPAAQDRVVEVARESLRRMGKADWTVTVQFWSGEPPPPGVDITAKPSAKPSYAGREPSLAEEVAAKAADNEARYGISLIRQVRIEGAPRETPP